MLSPSGRSRMWDKDADGYARGDGFGVLVLKTLSKALADKDAVECIIRETGINQDGRTKGITTPCPKAQSDLIRDTFSRAGLNLSNLSDRPQYFEAHGTGTAAGDPIEAQAISTVFFGSDSGYKRGKDDPPLYVGSIKTVLGHSEGAAGVAGVLKASLALQNEIIPPNLLFTSLNPKVEPFYSDLRILQKPQRWPEILPGCPRRAVVNSFGFGGANCHAILESFIGTPTRSTSQGPMTMQCSPAMMHFNFSAVSTKSLRDNLAAYSAYVKANPSISLRDLAWTLNVRRSTLPTRISLSASTHQELAAKLDDVSNTSSGVVTVHTSHTTNGKPRLLGIFTGQGAQWAQMGSCLIRSSSIVVECLEMLQKALDTLPAHHVPAWSLKDELLKKPGLSRIGEAAIAQPLCTAIQIALVELLKAARVSLAAVVGHSSGEVAASYAAGFISAQDAIRIAYYRGFFLGVSTAFQDTQGAMLVVETSHEDAQELCQLPSLEGKVCIAAKNSPTSVTLSGDVDAIEDVQEILEDEKKFARRLKVDKAYHSHHMSPCKAPYLEALRNVDIQIRTPGPDSPAWISSVIGENIRNIDLASLKSTYWADNMENTVLFSQSLEYAVGAHGPFDMAIEIGPHPALKAPASETIQGLVGMMIPYTDTLVRGSDDTKAFADTLGSLWMSLGSGVVDFAAFDIATYGTIAGPAKILKGLPTYAWDHDRSYSHETRYSRAFRTSGRKPHQLLGTVCPDETDNEFRFKNYLSPREIPWLTHHQIQGQIVFPAAGYISAVVEAIVHLHHIDSVQLVEITDITFGHALLIPQDSKIETLLSLKVIEDDPDYRDILFAFYSDGNKGSNKLTENASGRIRVIRGSPSNDSLPRPRVPDSGFSVLESDKFYNSARELGFEYEGTFRGLSQIARRTNEAIGVLPIPESNIQDSESLIIHPGSLDCAVQSLMIAYCYPRDGRLRTLHLPTRIEKLHVNLSAYRNCTRVPGINLPFYASIDLDQPVDFVGDVEVHSPSKDCTVIQVQGIHVPPLTPPSQENDVNMFTEMIWRPELLTGKSLAGEGDTFSNDYAVSFLLERVAYYYLRRLGAALPQHARGTLQWHHVRFLNYVDHCLAWVEAGSHPYVKKEWIGDSEEDILHIFQHIDLKLMKAVGDGLLPAMNGRTNILEAMTQDNMLDDFFSHSLAMPPYLKDMARMVAVLSHRFPHMNILEIGAGMGAATASILGELNSAFQSYTYTDISTTFFEKARVKFTEHRSKMVFKALDIEKPVSQQGFTEGSYDLVIASLSLHATRKLEETLENARSLLRPGGYLIMFEVTDNDPLRFGLIFGGLPGWWLGYDEGRKLSPCVSAETWEVLMRRTGFSGIDAITPHSQKFPFPVSVMAFQALDERVRFLRAPLAPDAEPLGLGSLTIIGGDEAPEALLADFRKHYHEIQCLRSLEDVCLTGLPFLGTVISLVDIGEESVFQDQRPTALEAIQNVLKQSRTVLWVTSVALAENPFKNIFVGLQRTVALEMTHVHVQVLNFTTRGEVSYNAIAEKILQLDAYEIWAEEHRVND
ncbi:hypothetical protein DL768_007803 [Monosporascus sp. mg162]|nr:hypothetical protein DL768_007803 [Monosporascus sp. mg162]